jgi:CheY-like chemotaxis protein/HPt (histidine-containing phosphotransfer) domain-containing protein
MAPYKLSVETASSGFEAIDKIKSGKVYDIVFMDHMMPKMDGIETVKNIRELGYKEPIIALTANAVVGQSEVFMENGFDGFISKPIDIRQLNAVLKQYVRDKQPPEVLEAAQLQQEKEQQPSSKTPAVIKLTPHFAEVLTRDFRKAIDALETIQAKQGDYNEDDIKVYTINTHGMKSALANIGEIELSAIALKLEKAAREKNIAVMSEGLPAFTKELHKMMDKFILLSGKPAESETANSETSSTGETVFLNEKLLAIKSACETFDKKAIKNALGELRQKTWAKNISDLLAAMDDNLLNGDYDEILKGVEKILDVM